VTIIEALKDEEIRVRISASASLVCVGKPAVNLLLQALKDEDSDFQSNVGMTLGALAMDRVGKDQISLLFALKDRNSNLSNIIAIIEGRMVLRKIREDEIKPIIRNLQSEDMEIQQKAIKDLIEISGMDDP